MATDGSVIRRGFYLYADTVRCEVRIVRRDFWYGIGRSDEPVRVDGRPGFYVEFGSPTSPTVFRSSSYALDTLEEAIREAEAAVGTGLLWQARHE